MVLETWREALPDRVIVAGARDITMAIEARRGRADALLAFPERNDPVGYHRRLGRELPGDRVLSLRGRRRRGVRRRHAARDPRSAAGGRHQGRHARFGHDLPANRGAGPRAIRTSCSSPARIASRLLGHGRARAPRSSGWAPPCPMLQAELLRRSRGPSSGSRFVALSALCDRLAQATFVAPMEGYIRRMLWAAAAEGALPRGGVRRSLGTRAARARSGRPSSRWCAMRAQLARDFERFGRELPRDFRRATCGSAIASTLAARYLGFSLPASDRQGLRPALAESGSARDRPRGRSRLRGAQDGDRRRRRGRPRHGRLGDPRDPDEGRARSARLPGGRGGR